MMSLILFSFSCTAHVHLRTPGGPRTTVWEMVLFIDFKGGEKLKKKKLVIYAPTGLEPVAVPMATIE